MVHATDSASDPNQRLWGSVTARVFVTDENDNAPIFSSPTAVSVMEDQPVGFVLLYVMARDADQGENGRVSYRIQSGNTAGRFGLSSNSGKTHYFALFENHLFLTLCCFMGRSLKSRSNLAERIIFLNGYSWELSFILARRPHLFDWCWKYACISLKFLPLSKNMSIYSSRKIRLNRQSHLIDRTAVVDFPSIIVEWFMM